MLQNFKRLSKTLEESSNLSKKIEERERVLSFEKLSSPFPPLFFPLLSLSCSPILVMFMYHCQTTKLDSYVQAAFNWRVESETSVSKKGSSTSHSLSFTFLSFATINENTIPMQMFILHCTPFELQVRSREIFPRSGLVSNWINAGLVWKEQLSAGIRTNKERLSKANFEAQLLEGSSGLSKQTRNSIGLEVYKYDPSRKLPICKAASLKPNQSNLEILAFSPLVWAVSIWLPVFSVSKVPWSGSVDTKRCRFNQNREEGYIINLLGSILSISPHLQTLLHPTHFSIYLNKPFNFINSNQHAIHYRPRCLGCRHSIFGSPNLWKSCWCLYPNFCRWNLCYSSQWLPHLLSSTNSSTVFPILWWVEYRTSLQVRSSSVWLTFHIRLFFFSICSIDSIAGCNFVNYYQDLNAAKQTNGVVYTCSAYSKVHSESISSVEALSFLLPRHRRLTFFLPLHLSSSPKLPLIQPTVVNKTKSLDLL